MKISLNWIGDYVDHDDLAPQDLADLLTVRTAEVEAVHEVTNHADQAVVARVTDVRVLGERTVVAVDDGLRRHRDVDCPAGAAVGDLVAYVPVLGTVCAPRDIGLGADDRVLRVPAGSALGAPLSRWIPTRDVLLEVDNKSLTHRPDLWGHYGFAREVAAVLGRPLRELAVTDLAEFDELPPVELHNDVGEDCPVVTALAVDVAAVRGTPLLVLARLSLMDVLPRGLATDISNYVLWELGQPTQFYDQSAVDSLRIAHAGELPQLRTSDGETRLLKPDDVVVFNGGHPVGLAGIMGVADASTTGLLLESATFRAARIRRTAGRLNLRTDAAQRYEKSLPPAMTRVAAARAFTLLAEAGANPVPRSRHTVVGDLDDQPRPLRVSVTRAADLAGIPLDHSRIAEVLTPLGFGTTVDGDDLVVAIPPFRSRRDIAIPHDIVEEVLRIIGYDQVPPRLPTATLEPAPLAKPVLFEHRARRVLVYSHDHTEVQTYLWGDDTWHAALGYDAAAGLRVRNPVAPERARLRMTLLPNLFKATAENLAHHDEVSLFEVGRVLVPGTPAHREARRLGAVSALVSTDPQWHLRKVRTAVEDVVRAIGRPPVRAEVSAPALPWEGTTVDLFDASGPIGRMGLLAAPLAAVVAPRKQVVWFELDLDALDGDRYPGSWSTPVSNHPQSIQDFSLLWPVERGFAALQEVLGRFTHPLVRGVQFVDVYSGLPDGMSSHTFRYWISAADRTLDAADLAGFRAALLAHLDTHGIALR
ncbi:phenylalanine--tRNA ligase subunit beta [Actinokineospora diospyrosa]|uniref:phenylalanine--tRNA ligase n=1 Tax=Actinokineospora diospyrosa TaxID=103728 RepID=A0ABT1INX0_9PSEU|nr:phenylalanine--tRNA ligase subunit beta [Actinokineospora diospyrosa]MCP2274367.1 phenylalanyl-tRNA synthetase beta subunit [Actinokineospora diospyrosa]